MEFGGIKYIAVLVAAIAALVFWRVHRRLEGDRFRKHGFVVCGGNVIEREDLPPHIRGETVEMVQGFMVDAYYDRIERLQAWAATVEDAGPADVDGLRLAARHATSPVVRRRAATLAAGLALGFPPEDCCRALGNLAQVPGRL